MPRAPKSPPYREYALIATFSLGIVWLGYLIWGIVPKEERARTQVHETQAALASLGARETTLRHDLAALDTERGKEAILRDTKGVARPGEEVIIVVPPEIEPAATTTVPWWRALLQWF